MRIIDAFVLILIAGIFSSTVALGHNASQNKGLLQSLVDLYYKPGALSVNFSTSIEKLKIVKNLLKESCEKNDGPHAYGTAMKGLQDFAMCDESSTNEMQSTAEANDKANLVDIVKKYCAIVRIGENCIKRLKDSIEPCVEVEEREVLKISYSVIISSLDFICDDDGARIMKFVADGGMECLDSKQQDLHNCLTQFSSHYNSPTISYEEKSAADKKLNILELVPALEDCNHMEKLQRCSFEALNECEHHTSADIIDALFDSVRKAIGCKNLYKSEASASSLGYIVSITSAISIIFRLFG